MQYIPKYINKKRNVVRLVLWTALYAELFITIYQPFNSRKWIADVTDLEYFIAATLAVLVAMGIIGFSRTMMYQYAKKHDISYLDYGIWVFVEIAAMSVVYAAAPCIALPSVGVHFLEVWGTALIYTAFILLIPYAITMMAFILQEYGRKLDQYGAREGRRRDTANDEMLNFYDEKGDLKLSVRPDSLFYIESADNYVKIHYLLSGKMQHFMLRNKLRNIEDSFQGKDLLRCHRSYIVSFQRVQVLKRTDDGLMVDFDYDGVPNIPVSKSYSKAIMERFTQDAKFV